jgi:hypothetical protein
MADDVAIISLGFKAFSFEDLIEFGLSSTITPGSRVAITVVGYKVFWEGGVDVFRSSPVISRVGVIIATTSSASSVNEDNGFPREKARYGEYRHSEKV